MPISSLQLHALGVLFVWTIILTLLQLTGRVEPKRRWSDGIHQAIEAKEGLKIQVTIDLHIASLQWWNHIRQLHYI